MNDLGLVLDRTTSGFPVSIGTALALESLFSPKQAVYDLDRPIPPRIDLMQYRSCWINLSTLFRNIVGAITPDQFMMATADQLVTTLLEEMDVIRSLFLHEGGNVCQVRYYRSSYKQLRLLKNDLVKLRDPSTDKQRYYANQEEHTLDAIEKAYEGISNFHDAVVPDQSEKALIITHSPYDLTGFHRFDRLDLLESHSGVLKPKALWASKYYPISDEPLGHLPFLKKLLLILGDKVLIRPNVMVMRKTLLDVSKKGQWHPRTTLDKVRLDVQSYVQDPYFLYVFNSI